MSVILRKKNRVTKLQTFYRNNPKLYVSVELAQSLFPRQMKRNQRRKSAFRGLDPRRQEINVIQFYRYFRSREKIKR